jgi:hypothetical protein
MTWKEERDLLIAQTAAFVQSVTRNTAGADPRLPSPSPVQPFAEERPVDVLPARLAPISHSLRHSDLRDEVGRRVAAFRARQQAFDRERKEYCNAMMTKARASSEQAVQARDNQPPKR